MDRGTVATAGRREELARLRGVLSGLTDGSGHGGAVLLRGEAGIGKSHLVDVAVDLAADLDVDVVRTQADELATDRPALLLTQLTAQLGDGAIESADRPPSPRRGDDPGYVLIDRVADLVESATTHRPVLLVAEDLHWADELSLRGLATVLRTAVQWPCVMVMTTRPHPTPPRLSLLERALRDAGGSVLDLGGLPPAAVEEIVVRLVGGRPGPDLRALLAGVAGNPFMVEELLRAAIAQDGLRVDAGVAEVTTARELPRSFRELLLQAVARLPGRTIEVLRQASLFGTRFTAAEIAALRERPVAEVVHDLRPALDAGLVRADDAHLGFRHDLVRAAIYGAIPSSLRWDLHRAAASALSRHGAPALRVAEQMAAGARPGDAEAVSWLRRAADDALALDTGAAADLLHRAISLAPDDWSGRFDAEAELVELLAWSGRIDDATARGQALVRRAVRPGQRVLAHRALGTVRSSIGDLRAAAAELTAAAQQVGVDDAEGAHLLATAAGMAVISGTSTAEEAYRRAQPLLDRHEPTVVCAARNTLAVAALAIGAYEEALTHALVARDLLEDRYVRPLGFLIPHSWVVASLMYLDRFEDAARAAQHGRTRAQSRGDVGLLVQLMAGTAGIRWGAGEWDAAAAEIEAAEVLARDTGVVVQTILFRSMAAHLARERGQADDADAHLAAAHAFASSGTMHLFGMDFLALEQARVLRGRGEAEAACDLLSGVWDMTMPIRGLIQWRSVAPELVGLCVQTGRHDRATAIAADLRSLAERTDAPSARATALRATGLAEGDAAVLVDAADAMLATPRQVEAAGTCEDAVQLLIAHGDDPRGDAPRLLDAAEAVYDGCGAVVALERIRELREQAGLATPTRVPRPTVGWASLTPKEHEIVDLVSQGLSNPDIASRLFISRRTVEAHLSHVFRKLDVRNRTQLARLAIEEGG